VSAFSTVGILDVAALEKDSATSNLSGTLKHLPLQHLRHLFAELSQVFVPIHENSSINLTWDHQLMLQAFNQHAHGSVCLFQADDLGSLVCRCAGASGACDFRFHRKPHVGM
jgi:hypothetical protein